MASSPSTSLQIEGEKVVAMTDFIFLGSKINVDSDHSRGIKRRLLLGRKAMTKLDSILKSRDITLPLKVCLFKASVFPVVLYRCENWMIKKAEHWRLHTVELCLNKILESPLDCKEIKPVNSKAIQPWIFIGRIDAEAEAPILWPPDSKSQLIGKDPDSGNDWGLEEKRVTEDEMIGWHHQLNGHKFEKTLGESEGQGSLACCSPWGHKELDPP